VCRIFLRVVDRDIPILGRLELQFDFGTFRQIRHRRLVIAERRTTTGLRPARVIVSGGIGIPQIAGRMSNGWNESRRQIVTREERRGIR